MVLVARASAGRRRSRRRSSTTAVEAYQQQAAAQERPRAHRAGQDEDRRLHRRVRDQPGQRRADSRSGSPTTCWPATAPARSWPCRRTTSATSSSPQQFDLPIVAVVDPGDRRRPWTAQTMLAGKRVLRRATASRSTPASFDGLPTAEFKAEDHRRAGSAAAGPQGGQLQAARLALQPAALLGRAVPDPARARRRRASRPGVIRAVPTDELPVDLPRAGRLQAARPARAAAGQGDRLGERRRSTASSYRRETNTMPQWAGSCWYYLRYIDPKNDRALRRPGEVEKSWMPVDLYVGGAEHAVLHLLYCALLAQGAVRPRPRQHARAVPAAGQPGDDPGRDGIHDAKARLLAKSRRRAQGDGPSRSRGDRRLVVEAALQDVKSRGNVVNPTSRQSTGRRCGCTRCSWVRSRRPSRGA